MTFINWHHWILTNTYPLNLQELADTVTWVIVPCYGGVSCYRITCCSAMALTPDVGQWFFYFGNTVNSTSVCSWTHLQNIITITNIPTQIYSARTLFVIFIAISVNMSDWPFESNRSVTKWTHPLKWNSGKFMQLTVNDRGFPKFFWLN